MRKKIFAVGVLALLVVLVVPRTSYAHVTVSPKEVGVGKFQTFNLSVPVEKEVATVGLRLVMPSGLEHVSPTVKPGWNIEIKHGDAQAMEAAGQHAGHGAVTEIIWKGGSIPQGQRDDFSFSAKVPSEQVTLSWKAYQTYADGSVVAWELGPNDSQPQKDGKPDFSSKGPASETKIIDDLTESSYDNLGDLHQTLVTTQAARRNSQLALVISVVALVASIVTGRRKQSAQQ